MRAALLIGLGLAACRPAPRSHASLGAWRPAPEPARVELEQLLPPGADVVVSLRLVELRKLTGVVTPEAAQLFAPVPGLGGLDPASDLDEITIAVYAAATPEARTLVLARGRFDAGQLAAGGGRLWSGPGGPIAMAGPGPLLAEAAARADAPPPLERDPRRDPGGLVARGRPAARLAMAVTPAVGRALTPLLGDPAEGLAALVLELYTAPGREQRALEARAVLAAHDEAGADALAETLRESRARLLASGALARLGLTRFVTPLTVDSDGTRAHAGYALGAGELTALRERVRVLGEVIRQLRARAGQAATP